MFYLKVKDKQNKFNILFNLIYKFLILIPFSLLITIANLININSQYSSVIEIVNLVSLISLLTLSSIAYLIQFSFSLHLRKLTICEIKNIIANVVLPKKLPKVVYVYTTKNDFMESRLAQNMQQTYKNIEYWISVGGQNDKNIEKIKSFAKRNNINLYIMDRDSTSKADNLNHFLKYSNVQFDYLLIGDADCAFNPNFVDHAIKLFVSPNGKFLGYVSSAVMNYRGNNCFTNSIMHFENEKFLIKELSSNYLPNLSPNLYSSCCLISQKMLAETNNLFPESNLEDWYLEKYANKNMWQGIILPHIITMQSFDKSIYANLNRISRLFTWGIKYQKEQSFKDYRVKYYKNNNKDFFSLFIGFFFILGFFIGTLIIYYLVLQLKNNPQDFLNNPFLLIYISTILINIILIVATKAFYLRKLNKHDGIKRILFFINYAIVLATTLFKEWFLSVFFSKYKMFIRKDAIQQNKKVSLNIITLVITSALLALINWLFFGLNIIDFNNNGFIYLNVLINAILGYIILYAYSFLVLVTIGHIKSNKNYDENNFVYCNNNFILQEDVKCLN